MSKVIVDTLENTAGTFTSAIDSLGPSTAFGGVGSYVWGRYAGSTQGQGQFIAGTTYTGSALYPAGLSAGTGYAALDYSGSTGIYIGDSSSSALSGTWRAMGTTNLLQDDNPTTIFVRIS